MNSPEQHSTKHSRRSFFKTSTIGLGSLFWDTNALGEVIRVDGYRNHEFELIRGWDLRRVKVLLLGFRNADPKKPSLYEPRLGSQPLVVLEFPPQNVAEAIFDLKENDKYEAVPLSGSEPYEHETQSPVTHYSSGSSWLAFSLKRSDRVDLAVTSELFSLLENRPLKVPPAADQPSGRVQEPRRNETRLEVPFQLLIAPESTTRVFFEEHTAYSIISHPYRDTVVGSGEHNGKHYSGPPLGTPQLVLWNALLRSTRKLLPAPSTFSGDVQKEKELSSPKDVAARARALWSPSYRRGVQPSSSLYFPADKQLSSKAVTRHLLVKQMSEGDGWIDIVHLVLTSLGANADLTYTSQKDINAIIEQQLKGGKQGGSDDTNLRLFKHKMTLGRDTFIVEAFLGFLFPFVIPAIYVEVTQRRRAAVAQKAKDVGPTEDVGPTGMFLLKKRYILALQSEKKYCSNESPFSRDCPVKSVRLTTLQTPNLKNPDTQKEEIKLYDLDENKLSDVTRGNSRPKGFFFWPKLQGSDQQVHWDHEVIDDSGKALRAREARLFFATNIRVGHYTYTQFAKNQRTLQYDAGNFALTREEKTPKDGSASKGSSVEVTSISFQSHRLDQEFRQAEQEAIYPSNGDQQHHRRQAHARNSRAIYPSNGDQQHPDSARLYKWIEAQGLDDDETKKKEFLKSLQPVKAEAQRLDCPYVHPAMDSTEAIIPALRDAATEVPARSVEYLPQYVSGGFRTTDTTPGVAKPVENEVFARLVEVIGKEENIGELIQTGIAQPAVIFGGLSRELGAVAADGFDDLKQYYEELKGGVEGYDLTKAIPNTKLFGGITLRSLIRNLSQGELPSVESLDFPDRIERTWSWGVQLRERKVGGILTFKAEENGNQAAALILQSSVTTDLREAKKQKDISAVSPRIDLLGYIGWCKKDGDRWTKSTSPSSGKLPVALNLLGLVELGLKTCEFKASYRADEPFNPKMDVELSKVEFLGPLKFVAALQKAIEPLIDLYAQDADKNLKTPSDPYGVIYDAQGITAGFDFTVPPVAFGAFSMRNLRLSSRLRLPYLGALSYRFALSSFANPFEISVMGYAGRGFIAFGMDTTGKRELEGALEFGGALSFEVPGARGNLYVMGGAYFKIANDSTRLDGYVRAGGCLRVIGMININATFILCVSHTRSGGRNSLYGTCEIRVNIDLGFFDKTVSVGMKKRIQGSDEGAAQEWLKSNEDAYEAPRVWLDWETEFKGVFKDANEYYQKKIQYIAF